MKRILSLILVFILMLSLVACGKSDEKTAGIKDSYQKLSYDDFNNLSMEKGYSPVENTDNSAIDFKRSFYISDNTGFNIIFFEVANTSVAHQYFNFVMQTYESYYSEFSALQKYNDYGCYIMKDQNAFLYVAFVENTILYSLTMPSTADASATCREKTMEFAEYFGYPTLAIPDFKE